MTRRTRSGATFAWTIAVASVVGMALSEGLSRIWDVSDEGEFPLTVAVFIGVVAMGAVGAVVASRTRNPIGWILLAIPAGVTVSQLADTLMKHGATERPSYLGVASWLTTWPFLLALLLPVAIFYLYPTGTIPSPRWRWPWRIYLGASIITVVGFAVQPGVQRPVTDAPPILNPFGIDALEPALGIVLAIAGIALLLSALASFVSLATRYRVAGSEERQQLRWLFAVGAVGVFLIVALLATVTASGDPDEGFAAALANLIILLLAADVSIGIPVAAGIAIFRYRLYDLNLVVRRAVIVATMAAAITAVYLAIVVAVPFVIRGRTGEGIDMIPLLAAAVVAITFDPLRRATRRVADLLVYGERATPYEVLTAFGTRVGDAYASEDVAPRMAQILGEGTGAERGTVWLRVGGELRREAAWPVDDGRLDDTLPHRRCPADDAGRARRRGPAPGGTPRCAQRRDAGERADGSGERAAGPRSRRAGGSRAAERPPDRGASRITSAPRCRAGRGAPQAGTQPARRRAAAARRARRAAEARANPHRPRSGEGRDDARRASGICERRARGSPRSRARDLPSSAGRQRARRCPGSPGAEGHDPGPGRARRDRPLPLGGRVRRVLLVPRGAE